MKTRKNILLIVSLTILISLHLNATINFFTGENPAKENPELLISDMNDETFVKEFNFEDEEYINDIPFDIECISAQCKYEKAINEDFFFEDEEYIDDMAGLIL